MFYCTGDRFSCCSLCWLQSDGISGLATLIVQHSWQVENLQPTYMHSWNPWLPDRLCSDSVWVRAWVGACLNASVCKGARLSVCLGIALRSSWQTRVCSCKVWSCCSNTHLEACGLKNTGLKISPRVLALSRFLEPFWHTLAKCFSRQWRVSQYWGGRLGVLAIRRSSWAHSSGFTTSVETDKNSWEVDKTDVKNRSLSKSKKSIKWKMFRWTKTRWKKKNNVLLDLKTTETVWLTVSVRYTGRWLAAQRC